MRIKIIQPPTAASIDGIRLDRFEVGASYEVGTSLGSVLLAEGWAAPADPARQEPLNDTDRGHLPPNLIVERRRALPDRPSQAADRSPRRRRSRKTTRSR